MESLRGKTILVTGAGTGIGNALCQELSKAGSNVIALSLYEEELRELQSNYANIQIKAVDLKDWNNTREVLSNVPLLDGLVNNAGVAVITPFAEVTQEEFDHHFDVNVKAVFNVTQALLPKLKDGASIVMVSSVAAPRTFDGHSAYSATKAAVDSLTRSLALELGPRKIRVNSVNPTAVMTSMGRQIWSDPKKSKPLLDHTPLRRFCEVHEVNDVIQYLLSDQSSFVNGHHMNINGGYTVS